LGFRIFGAYSPSVSSLYSVRQIQDREFTVGERLRQSPPDIYFDAEGSALPDRDPEPELPRENDTSLANALELLTRAMFAVVKECKENGTLAARRTTYTLRPNFNLMYSVDPTIMNFGIEQVEEEVWDYKNQSDFLEARIQGLPELQAVESLIGQEPHHRQMLRNFMLAVAHSSLSATAPQPLTGHVETLLGDLQTKERPCKGTVWLTGVTLASECISVSDTPILRRPTRHDLQEKVTAESAHYAHALQAPVSFSCIAELRLRYLYPMTRQDSVEKLALALRLFRLGAVASSAYAFEEDSFRLLANVRFGGPSRAGREAYELSPGDAANLADFLAEINPLLPTQFGFPKPKADFFPIALHWFGEALLAPLPPEGSVASAVACLEALFLENVQAEMSYRLGLRVAGLLRCFGFPSLEVQAIVKSAYNVRSRYVHGDEQDKEWTPQELLGLSRAISDYARIALLAFCQLKEKIPRGELLARVERSLLDDKSREELQATCGQIKFCRKPTCFRLRASGKPPYLSVLDIANRSASHA
jgi:hypothetical protein